MSFRHNSTGVDPNSFELVEDGWYLFKIADAEEMKSSKGNDMVLVKAKVLNDDRYPDTEIWHYVTFLPADNRGAGISVQFRSCIEVPHGGNDIVNAKDWIGKRFSAYVTKETYEGNTRNKLTKISPPRDVPKLEEPYVAGEDHAEIVDDDHPPKREAVAGSKGGRRAPVLTSGSDTDIEF